MQSIVLHKGREQSVMRRHPWIFSRAIQSDTKGIKDGETVFVRNSNGQILGTGHYQNSSLSVRLIAFEEINPDHAFWLSRLQDAAHYRLTLGLPTPGFTDTFRLIHGEGDQLPGLIVDIYNRVAVVQAHSIGMYKALPEIASALTALPALQIHAVYSKSKDALPSNFAHDVTDDWIIGRYDEDLRVLENGISFAIDIVSGQKTGFFLDQRVNREWIRRYAKGKEVLNTFSYTGGFSIYALAAGASQVISVDSSAGALALLEKNLDLTAFPGIHDSVKDNVMTYLTHSTRNHDIVVVDPPAFAKSLSKRHNAVQAYKRLNMMAMARVKKGGMLFTFSCSQVVDKPLFHNTIVAAAIESGRLARVVHELSQGPDHPVSIFHPEGHYLKGLALYLD